MITSRTTAEAICTSGERLIATLNQALHEENASSSQQEFEKLKQAVGLVIGTLDVEILAPLYKLHPGLEPESLRGNQT